MFCDIHLIAISQDGLMNLICSMWSEITIWNSLPNLPGANELKEKTHPPNFSQWRKKKPHLLHGNSTVGPLPHTMTTLSRNQPEPPPSPLWPMRIFSNFPNDTASSSNSSTCARRENGKCVSSCYKKQRNGRGMNKLTEAEWCIYVSVR